jgi:hypothetical protein
MHLELSLTVEKIDYDKLTSGENIAILFRPFPIGRKFALAPLINNENGENTEFLSNTFVEVVDKEIISQDKINIDLANLLNISLENLREKLSKADNLLLIYFRVYWFESQIKVLTQNQLGFLPLPQPTFINDSIPLINGELFKEKQQQVRSRQLSKYSKLHNLHVALNQISVSNQTAQLLNQQIQIFLGYSGKITVNPKNQNLSWIKTISTLGDRSIELEEKKNTYQAGTDFENIAKKGLEFLGFTIDASHKGGAGGLDLFCAKPYPLIGECKAGKSIPSGTTEELIKLGGMRLETEQQFRDSTKLIVGAGNPTPDVITASHKWKVSIIKAMTLQKLVELKSKYNGAIDLFKLKEKLQAGQIDTKIDEYINDVEGEIKLRSHIVQVVKDFLQNNDLEDSDSNVLFGVYAGSRPPQNLKPNELRDILVELSSPLAGYLGRVEEGGKKCDRFYFLRDLLT